MATDIDVLLNAHAPERSALIPLLQDIQESQGYLSRESIVAVGKRLRIAPSKVYGVATFYNQFRFAPPGRFHIQLCRGTACHVKRSAKLLERVQRELNIAPGQTTRDGIFSLEVVACMGACSLAPVLSVGGRMHARVTPEDVSTILETYRRRANSDEQPAGE